IDGVIVTPDEFIPIAENSNLILKIGDWVLEKAHKLGIEWQEKGIDVPISVNISDVQFKNGASLLSTLHKLVTESKGKSSNLTLEVSENVIAENVELAAALLFEIQSYGFRISIDGFGVGFSSLSVLSKLKVDEIKIDRHFLKDVPSDPKSTAILKSIIMLGKSMDFRVVVMGVETKAQSDILKKYECDEFQGFLISEPLDWDEFLGWLNNYNQSN
ncbi:MAG: EAL domain-containing protein, partial [Kordiimonadaceae bacterium]|nr:EAL domain-containing protein [Kordiimonadaceae bacterium]